MNYSETYFELDSEEYIVIFVTLSLVEGTCQYTVQRSKMHVCVKMMLKGLALTVLIVTHVTQVQRVRSGVCGFYCNTAYRVTQFVTHVERVESV